MLRGLAQRFNSYLRVNLVRSFSIVKEGLVLGDILAGRKSTLSAADLTPAQKLCLLMNQEVTKEAERQWLEELDLESLSDAQFSEAVLLLLRSRVKRRAGVKVRRHLQSIDVIALALEDLGVQNSAEWLLAAERSEGVTGLEIQLKTGKKSIARLTSLFLREKSEEARRIMLLLMLQHGVGTEVADLWRMARFEGGEQSAIFLCHLGEYNRRLVAYEEQGAGFMLQLEDHFLDEVLKLSFANDLSTETFVLLWQYLAEFTGTKEKLRLLVEKLGVSIINNHFVQFLEPDHYCHIFECYSRRSVNNPTVSARLKSLLLSRLGLVSAGGLARLGAAVVKYVRMEEQLVVKVHQRVKARLFEFDRPTQLSLEQAFKPIEGLVGPLKVNL